MKINELCDSVINNVGGNDNLVNAENCMTRLRLTVRDESKVNESTLKDIDGVLGLVHDTPNYYEVVVGPGTCKQCADYINKNILVDTSDSKSEDSVNWKENKAKIKGKQKTNPVKNFLKTLGEIFVPLIPAVIAAGLCAGFASLIVSINPQYEDDFALSLTYAFLNLIKVAFLSYIGAWVGYKATEKFGGTPILGGILGLIIYLPQTEVAGKIFTTFLNIDSFIYIGSGGVISAIIGAWLISKVEAFFHKVINKNFDMALTPLLTLLVCLIPFIFIIMPGAGMISNWIAFGVQSTIMSDNVIIRGIAGFVSASLFLPLVTMGMHHALIPVYTVQLQQIGFITLYPSLCMGGFGQIGAAIAIYIHAKKYNNKKLKKVITGTFVPAVLGVGEPLIYSVTLPMFRPFITAGLAAGVGGAICTVMQCASTTWGPSGLLGVFVVNAGPLGVFQCVLVYLIAGVISAVLGIIFTYFFVDKKSIKEF